MEGTDGSAEPAVLRRNRAYLAAAASPCIFGAPLAVFAALTGAWAFLMVAVPLGLFGLVGLLWAHHLDNDPVRLPGKVSITEEGVFSNGQPLALRNDLEGGAIALSSGRTFLRLERKSPRSKLSLEMPSEAEAHAALLSLGLDASQRVSELKAASPALEWPVTKQLVRVLSPFLVTVPMGILLALLGKNAGPAIPMVVSATIIALVTYIFAISFHSTTVRVGVDGMSTSWFGRETFIGFANVQLVKGYKRERGGKTVVGVELLMKDGSSVRIPTGQDGGFGSSCEELTRRLQEALTLHRTGTAEAVDPSLFARRGRSTADWITAIRSLAAGGRDDMRTAPVSIETMLALIDDASAPAGSRVGAAVAALASAPEEARDRARIAAQTTVSPKLRIALERVASTDVDPDEAALAEALALIEDAPTTKAAEKC